MQPFSKLAPPAVWLHGAPPMELQLRTLYNRQYLKDDVEVWRTANVQDTRKGQRQVDNHVGTWKGHVVRNPNQRTNFITGMGNAGDTMSSSSQWVILIEFGADVTEGDTLKVLSVDEFGVPDGRTLKYEASYVDDDSSFLPAIMIRATYLGVDQNG